MAKKPHLFRDEGDIDVTHIELFFDLVFVFAITQLSHHLRVNLSLFGALEGVVMLLAIWWAWIFTSWTTNWLDCNRAAVRLLLLAMMLGGLALASAMPNAFGSSGPLFAGAYLAMQMGRSTFMIVASRKESAARTRNAMRIGFWFLLSAPFWVWGALQADPVWRLTGWSLALTIEFLGPFRGFRTPGLGVSQPSDWQISGHHMAERCALFIIITLGEAILVTGATYGGLVQGRDATLALVASFIGSAAMWWIYFDIGAKRGAKMIVQSTQIGLLARNAYTYLHVIIVAGIVVTAVADAIMLNGPTEAVTPSYLAVAIGGPVLFLMGCALFKRVSSSLQYLPLSHGVGQVLLTVLAVTAWATEMSVLATGAWATAILILTSVWEWLSLHGGWQRWTPWMEPVLGRFTPPS